MHSEPSISHVLVILCCNPLQPFKRAYTARRTEGGTAAAGTGHREEYFCVGTTCSHTVHRGACIMICLIWPTFLHIGCLREVLDRRFRGIACMDIRTHAASHVSHAVMTFDTSCGRSLLPVVIMGLEPLGPSV